MSSTLSQLSKLFQGKRVIIPLILGLGVAVYLILKDFDPQALSEFQWSSKLALWISLAILMMVFRDLGYILRLRILSDRQLSWKQSFQLTFLWEFASAISPGIVGGTAAAFVLLAQENIKAGRSTAIVLSTSFLDVLFYVITVPILILFTGLTNHIPEINVNDGVMDRQLLLTYFVVAYIILLVWAVLVYIGLFHHPKSIKKLIVRLFSLPGLKRWKQEARGWGDDLIIASLEYRKKGIKFWLAAYGATFFSWVARFAAVNFIILAFSFTSMHGEIFIRQLIMWCILLLPITPGASILAETVFASFLGPFFPNFSLAKVGAVLWRVISYYPYLLIGFLVFPLWLNRIILQRKNLHSGVEKS